MIERKFRLPSSVVFVSPLIIREKEFLMKMQKNNLSYNRFGFVAGKAVSKLATERNHIKRIFRSHIEQRWLGRSGGYDILFVLRPGIVFDDVVKTKIDNSLGKA
ncbi:MAG TPA: ribonuclease P protein component, partial [Patescibacteria group bacterium]|nr:ribonuclease P protein component [Patescibacteria group bacterium]